MRVGPPRRGTSRVATQKTGRIRHGRAGASDRGGGSTARLDVGGRRQPVNSSALRSSKRGRRDRAPPEAAGRPLGVRGVDHRGQFGELRGVEVTEFHALTIEREFHPQRGLPQLGVGLGGATEDQALVASGHAVLVVNVVQAKTDECGSESSGLRVWMAASASSRSGPFSWEVPGSTDGRAGEVPGTPARPARLAIVLSDSPRTHTATAPRIPGPASRPARLLRSTQAILGTVRAPGRRRGT